MNGISSQQMSNWSQRKEKRPICQKRVETYLSWNIRKLVVGKDPTKSSWALSNHRWLSVWIQVKAFDESRNWISTDPVHLNSLPLLFFFLLSRHRSCQLRNSLLFFFYRGTISAAYFLSTIRFFSVLMLRIDLLWGRPVVKVRNTHSGGRVLVALCLNHCG